jgi:hypothetical protein
MATVGARLGDWWTSGLRLLVLLVLLAGAASVLVGLNPAQRQEQDLVADLAAGRVTYLEYQPGFGEVRWATGWWRWYKEVPAPPEVVENPAGDLPPRTRALQRLQQQVDASGHPVVVDVSDDARPTFWPSRIAWGPLQLLTTVAWVGTFLFMLGGPRHRYANRWAWFWLFTIGQAGVLLYLVLEPRPVWHPSSWPAPPGRKPIGGGSGFVYGILLAIALSLVAVAFVAVF